MKELFTLPKTCYWCRNELDNKEIVVLEDYKLMHPWCFLEWKRNNKMHKLAEVDSLASIFKLQAEFQERLKTKFNQEFITTMTVAAIDELMEALRETPWKPWMRQQKFDKEKYKNELVDVLHFFINLCLAADMTAEELYSRYYSKMQKNHLRQAENY